ncbi:MAG: LysR family transcriptional regulator [Eubacteriales bacterium]|nr:LysR family transcriptional regulator [Eubacteriales bacterium]
MLDTKQLQYFVTAAESTSFSEAAAALYSTQSNVSKTIAALENQLGYPLFQREANGIHLNARGKVLYTQVLPLLEKLEELEMQSAGEGDSVFRLSINPSSWFARSFSDFYSLHEAENIRYNIHTDTTFHILKRVRDMEDEIGFIYVFPEEFEQVNYELNRYQLVMETLGNMTAMLYRVTEDAMGTNAGSGAENGSDRNAGKDADAENCMAVDSGMDRKGGTDKETEPEIRLIQAEMDLPGRYRNWNFADTNEPVPMYPVAITTNSDYIMNTMIKKNGLCSISPRTFSQYEKQERLGRELQYGDREILFGVVRRRNSELSAIAEELIHFIRERIGQYTEC